MATLAIGMLAAVEGLNWVSFNSELGGKDHSESDLSLKDKWQ